MIQCIECKCGSVFAACTEPECWTDTEWQKDVRKYVKEGHKIVMKERGTWTLESCKCNTDNQLELL